MTFGPHRKSEETYLAYTRADDSSPARQARLVPASTGDYAEIKEIIYESANLKGVLHN